MGDFTFLSKRKNCLVVDLAWKLSASIPQIMFCFLMAICLLLFFFFFFSFRSHSLPWSFIFWHAALSERYQGYCCLPGANRNIKWFWSNYFWNKGFLRGWTIFLNSKCFCFQNVFQLTTNLLSSLTPIKVSLSLFCCCYAITRREQCYYMLSCTNENISFMFMSFNSHLVLCGTCVKHFSDPIGRHWT